MHPGERVLKEANKMVNAHPRAGIDAFSGIKIKKCNDHTVHGFVAEQDQPYQHRKYHDILPDMLLHIPRQSCTEGLSGPLRSTLQAFGGIPPFGFVL